MQKADPPPRQAGEPPWISRAPESLHCLAVPVPVRRRMHAAQCIHLTLTSRTLCQNPQSTIGNPSPDPVAHDPTVAFPNPLVLVSNRVKISQNSDQQSSKTFNPSCCSYRLIFPAAVSPRRLASPVPERVAAGS